MWPRARGTATCCTTTGPTITAWPSLGRRPSVGPADAGRTPRDSELVPYKDPAVRSTSPLSTRNDPYGGYVQQPRRSIVTVGGKADAAFPHHAVAGDPDPHGGA